MSDNSSILLINPEFDPASAPACDLLVKVSPCQLSYAILDTRTSEVIALFDEPGLDDGPAAWASRLQTDHYLSLPYRQTRLSVCAPQALHVPNALFSTAALPAYAPYFPATAGQLYTFPHRGIDVTTVFSVPAAMRKSLAGKPVQLTDATAAFIALAQTSTSPSLFLDFSSQACTVAFISGGRPVFQQQWETDHAEEFNYFLLLMLKELQVPGDCAVYLSGLIHEGDEWYRCVAKYFAQITFLTPGGGLEAGLLDDMPAHYYTLLLALNECGSLVEN